MTSRSPWRSTTGEGREGNGECRTSASAISFFPLHRRQVPGRTLHSEGEGQWLRSGLWRQTLAPPLMNSLILCDFMNIYECQFPHFTNSLPQGGVPTMKGVQISTWNNSTWPAAILSNAPAQPGADGENNGALRIKGCP